jgi:truncated hemoglobin YjbI
MFTWLITADGAALVFFTRTVNQKLLDAVPGFSAAVMLAASDWSLLAPAIEFARSGSWAAWIIPALRFLFGGGLTWGLDRLIPHLHADLPLAGAERPKTRQRQAIRLVTAMTLHNIPEGPAVGAAFGAVVAGVPEASLGGCGRAGDRDWNPEFSRWDCRGDAASRRRHVGKKEFDVRAVVCRSRTGGNDPWCIDGGHIGTGTAVCPLPGGRGHDRCRCRGTAARFATLRQRGYVMQLPDGRLRQHDDSGFGLVRASHGSIREFAFLVAPLRTRSARIRPLLFVRGYRRRLGQYGTPLAFSGGLFFLSGCIFTLFPPNQPTMMPLPGRPKRATRRFEMETLYDRIGPENIERLVVAFYQNVLSDPLLRPFFEETSIEKLQRMQIAFFTIALGGPAPDAAISLYDAHRGRGIERKHLSRFTEHLMKTLHDIGIEESDAHKVYERIATYSDEVLGESSVDG